MSDEDVPKVDSLFSVFPFVMVISAVFVTGLISTAVNVPLLFQVLRGYADLPLVAIADTAANFWKGTLPSSPGLGVVLLFMFVLFTMGFVVQPVAIVYATIVGKAVEWASTKRWKSVQFYSPAVAFGDSHLVFADWIHRHRVEKSHYEWELFQHYLYAGIAFNVGVGAFLTWRVTRHEAWIVVVLVTTVVLSTAYSLARSAVVRQVYDFYSRRAKNEVAEPATASRDAR